MLENEETLAANNTKDVLASAPKVRFHELALVAAVAGDSQRFCRLSHISQPNHD